MIEILNWMGLHWFLGIVIVSIVVGGISDVVDGRTKLARVIGENDALKAQLALKGNKNSRRATSDEVHTLARMARLLDKVQEADTTIPQLNSELRLLIDVELENYHKPPAVEPPKKGKKS